MSKVWVNGTFDVLHRGHIELLKYASEFGLVRVGIDSDKRVKRLKGSKRPVNNLSDRIFFMKSIKYVQSVVSFNSDKELIKEIEIWNPDIMIVGSDYIDKNIIGSDLCKNILFFNRIEKYSSTKIINYDKDISNR